MVIRHMVPEYTGNNYKIIHIAFGHEFRWGKECIWTGKVSDNTIQETVLMALPKK